MEFRSPILRRGAPASPDAGRQEGRTVVQTRIKPYFHEAAVKARRGEQQRIFRRNQIFGILLVAAAILVWWLFHTNPKWIFPPGWWRP